MRRFFSLLLFSLIQFNAYPIIIQDNVYSIKGIVSNENGSGLGGATIVIENTQLGINTSSSGSYSFSGIRSGVYTLRFSFLGYESESRTIEVTGETVLDITLKTKSFITGEVTINATRAGDNSPLAYSTVDKQVLKDLNTGPDLPYLLSLTPSLVETSESGNGIGYTSLRIRGTDGNRINVTIDGIPLNDPESQQVFWVDLPDLASSIDNIQVQRGAGTSTNGAGAFGATINIQTISLDNEPFAEVNSSAGSFNTFKNSVSAGTGLIADKFALQMRYSDIRSDGYIDRTGSNHESAYIGALFKSGKSRIKANVFLGKEHTGIGWWGVPKDSLETNRKYNPAGEYTDEDGILHYYGNESDNYTQNHYQLIYSFVPGKYLSLNTALHYTKGKGYYEEYREDQELSDYGLPAYNIGNVEISETDMIRQKWMSNDFFGMVYSLKYNKGRIEAVAGGGMNMYLGDHYGNIIWMRNAGTTEKDYRWYLNNSEKGEITIYGKVNYALSERTSFFGDLQYRHVVYNMSGLDDDLKDITQEHSFEFINPKGGLFFRVSSNQSAYISFSVANREPTRTDFKEASGDNEATPRPETLYDTELGYKIVTGNNTFAVNLYGMFYNDQLVPTGELSNVGYSIMTNVSKSYRVGLEVVAGIKPADFIDWNMNLTLSRNKINGFVEYYTDYNTEDWSSQYLSKDLGDVDIAYSPSVTGASDLSFSIHPKINLHLLTKYVGKQYFDNTMNEDRKIDSYLVNNLRLDYEPVIKSLKGVVLQLQVNNILNERYESNGYGGNWYENGTEKTWSYYFPQAGINYMLRIGMKF